MSGFPPAMGFEGRRVVAEHSAAFDLLHVGQDLDVGKPPIAIDRQANLLVASSRIPALTPITGCAVADSLERGQLTWTPETGPG